MGFSCGIVGLPNVGKSTLFNALTKTRQAEAKNYPFCTIEPNKGDVAVPDPRLNKLAAIANSKAIIPTRLAFVDIAGLVRGASKGEGLGNQFLANIREVDAIIHVLRCFEDSNVTHVDGQVDPVADMETVDTELMLADMESLERQLASTRKRLPTKDKESAVMVALIEKILAALNNGIPAREVTIEPENITYFKQLNLLTAKPVLYVCNVDESAVASGNRFSDMVKAKLLDDTAMVLVAAEVEMAIADLEPLEQKNYLDLLGLEESGLARIITAGYRLLDLITYFTAGEKEARAWTIKRGSLAPQAAGRIHSDFEKGFIRAQTIAYSDYIEFDGEHGAKQAGKAYDEGKAYVVRDGDVLLFRFAT